MLIKRKPWLNINTLTIGLSFFLCILGGTAKSQAWPEKCTVNVDVLNVRAAPGTDNPIIAKVRRGRDLAWWLSEYDADGDIWHRFPLGDGRHGFVAAKSTICNFNLKTSDIDQYRTIALFGEIGPNYSSLVKQKLRQLRDNPIVFLNSPGGIIIEAMKAGIALRESGAAITVNGECASACLYVFASGVYRITNMKARLGLHRAFLPTRELTLNERRSLLKFQREYLAAMGVNPVFADISDAKPGSPVWFNEQQLWEWGMITDLIYD